MGKSGQLTPVACFDNVVLDGTDVSRCSCHNISYCKNLKLGIGAKVKVIKAMQIIPQIIECVEVGDELILPTTCPICSGKTAIIKENESEVLVCTNPECSGKLLGKLKFFVSKPAANIDGLSEATLAFLIDRGWVKSFRDIYHLDAHKNEWQRCDGFGKKSVEKILGAIEKSRNIDLAHFICSLSIPNIGSSAAKTISQACDGNFRKLLDLWGHQFDFTTLDDFGVVMANSLDDYITHNCADIVLLSQEMHFIVPEKKNVVNNLFTGKTLCVTGKFNRFTRDSINEKITSLGAKAASSVSKKTDYLITNEASGSSKYKKAIELNVPIITEDEFIKMIG